jgi:hypothetical protein
MCLAEVTKLKSDISKVNSRQADNFYVQKENLKGNNQKLKN